MILFVIWHIVRGQSNNSHHMQDASYANSSSKLYETTQTVKTDILSFHHSFKLCDNEINESWRV